MKTSKLLLSLLAFVLLLGVTSCKKDDAPANNDAEATTHSDDQSRFESESDNIANEINVQIESMAAFSGRQQDIQSFICGASIVVDANSNPRTITITFNDSTCVPGRRRTGVIVLSMAQGVYWKDAGAQINVSFQNLKITRMVDNKSITFNGTKTYTNVSGGLLVNLASLPSITHTITSNGLTLSFDNGTQRTWMVAKQRVFTYSNGIVITGTGTHTQGNITNIAEWGTNRFGRTFTTSTETPLVVKQDCNFRLTSGKIKHATQAFTASATFGLDATGAPTTCPGLAAYYYKLEWTGPNGGTHSVLIPY
jgi:hypothetical protein